MRRSALLHVEALEARENPARFGTPWPDGQNLTLSFAPDGTAIGGRAGDLGALLAALGPDARADVLRAVQNWVVRANVNVGLVADDGSAFGTVGSQQSDPRFGDIRIGGIALPDDVLAVTAPFNYYDHFSGNVVINTAGAFGAGGVDLFTAMLQEAGHAFGVSNSPDTASAMYEFYRGERAGLSSGDVAAIQQLYGARQPDQFEGVAGNDTLSTATAYVRPVTADLTTAADVDVFRFRAGPLTSRVTVNLRAAGLSLVAARVELLNSSGVAIASASATDPTANDIELSSSQIRSGATYFVRVTAARSDAFGVGSYQLSVAQRSILSPVTGLLGTVLDTVGDTLLSATALATNALGVGPQTEFAGGDRFHSNRDVDFYRFTVPPSSDGQPVNLVTSVWGLNGAALNAWIDVRDAFGTSLRGEVVTADGTATVIQVRGLARGGTYFLRLASDTGTTGAYRFAADLRETALKVSRSGEGMLNDERPSTSARVRLAQSGQMHFVLSAEGAAGSAAELVVSTPNGQEVAHFSAAAGRGRSLDVFLAAGEYVVTIRSTGKVADVAYSVGLTLVTDPVGPSAADPVRNPDPPPSDAPPSDPPPSSDPPSDTDWQTPEYTADSMQWY